MKVMARLSATDARITGPILAAFIYFPAQMKRFLPRLLRPLVKSSLFLKALIGLFGIDILRKSNRVLSHYTANNFRSVKFIPNRELVLITGGSSGLGLLMAKDFARHGVKVVIIDLQPPKEQLPSDVYFYKCDVSSVSVIADTAAEIRKDHGDPTVLINNAGIGFFQPIFEGTEQQIRSTFEVNTISHFWMTREFVPAMIKKNQGHVVTIASLASYFTHAVNVDYCCSKASALCFHEGLTSELRNFYKTPNIRTTAVTPSWIRTPLIERMIRDDHWKAGTMEPEYVTRKIVKHVMAGHGGQIVLPPDLNFLTTIRGWPLWLQTWLRNHLGEELKIVWESLQKDIGKKSIS